jgi:hypothetical protein
MHEAEFRVQITSEHVAAQGAGSHGLGFNGPGENACGIHYTGTERIVGVQHAKAQVVFGLFATGEEQRAEKQHGPRQREGPCKEVV